MFWNFLLHLSIYTELLTHTEERQRHCSCGGRVLEKLALLEDVTIQGFFLFFFFLAQSLSPPLIRPEHHTA